MFATIVDALLEALSEAGFQTGLSQDVQIVFEKR